MDNQSRLERLLDENEVRRARQLWAFSRDLGEWDTMRSCFHPDATVTVSWYSGPVATFFERTIAMSTDRRPEERSKHWFGNSRVTLHGRRALLETDTQVLGRDWLDGHLFDFATYGRMFDRVEQRDGAWKILRMIFIYDKDRLDPVIPGSVPAAFFAGTEVSGPESGFAMMRFRQTRKGRTVPPDIVIGGSAGEAKCKAEAAAWLAGG
jgi:hypothetical protein